MPAWTAAGMVGRVIDGKSTAHHRARRRHVASKRTGPARRPTSSQSTPHARDHPSIRQSTKARAAATRGTPPMVHGVAPRPVDPTQVQPLGRAEVGATAS